MKIKSILLILSLAAVLFGSIFFAGCGSKSLEGERLANIHPIVEWALVPQDSLSHSSNPGLQWYGRDVDGQISALEYQYIVVLEEDADTYGGAAAMAAAFPLADSLWMSLGNVTSAQVPLYASADTSVFVDQFVFLRCEDDYGDYSNIIYLYLSRNNHPPTCAIFVPAGPQWCLPDTSDFWNGINVSWEGKDSLDYTGIQPDFIWETRIYGPFDTVPDSADTLPEFYLYNITDPETGDSLNSLESCTLTDLVTGWYIVYVRNFDDASVPSVPALDFLEVFEPNWIRNPDETKDILLIDHNWFRTWFGELPSSWRDSVGQFFENVLNDAGFPNDRWDWSGSTSPPITTLYKYRMVIVSDIDYTGKLLGSQQEILAEYLNIGGKLWILGRQSFAMTSNTIGRVDYGPGDDLNPLAYTYMDLSAAYFPPGEDSTEIGWVHTSEFDGAIPLFGNFPILEVDTVRTLGTSWEWPLNPDRSYDFTTLPRVEYLIRNPNSETIYTFDAINPDTSRFHGFPVAVRNQNAVFKTSYFSFSLFFIKYDQASLVANEMLTWFLE